MSAPLALAMALTLVQGVPEVLAAADPAKPKDTASVNGHPAPLRARKADPERRAVPPRAVTWPRPGSASGDPTATKDLLAGDLPVTIGPAGQTSPGKVDVQVLDRQAAAAAGLDGLLIRVRRDDQPAAAPMTLRLDYKGFSGAGGGDWASRLRLVQLPTCAATTPDHPECRTATAVPSSNDTAGETITAQVTAAGDAPIYALTAAPSGGSGDFTSTPLSASGTWDGGDRTGEFTWTYPLRTPPGLGGPEPEMELSYSSGSVDGRTASTNNQSSWIGEGWDMSVGGFVERRYKPCTDDGVTPSTGDQCWGTDNATVSLGGATNELVRDDATGTWHMKNDDATKVERLTGAANGDDDGEHWKITTTDGTQYYFGLNRLPGWASGKAVTDSTWTVPVFGDDAGEPCHGSAYASSWCQQAWRWNLDYVVDPHGTAAAYWYKRETNYYGLNMKATSPVAYTRGGYLDHIDYGQRSDSLFTAPPARVSFVTSERCLPTGTFDCTDAKFTTANASHWPDVPVDQNCASGDSCTNRYAPTFWSRRRLTSVTTQAGGKDVDSWTFTHAFPAPGDGTDPALWLESVQQTGKNGGSLSLPAVTFDGVQMANRVDGQEGLPPFTKRRISAIYNETGGQISVGYSEPECVAGHTPAPDANGKRCFPQYWTPDGASDPIRDWFHKYVVTQVDEVDRTGGAPFLTTSYEYVGAPAWHYDDDDGLTKDKYRTWSQWRGYQKVRVYTGDPSGQRSQEETLYFRGMDGDKTSTGTRSATVTDSEGTTMDDKPWLEGFAREEITYNGAGGAVVEGTINDPWTRGPTATRTRSWGTTKAYMVDTAKTRTRTALSAGGYRRTEVDTSYDDDGQEIEVSDLGDVSTPADDQCIRTTYARNDQAWMIDKPAREETVSVACDATPDRSKDLISDTRNSYDGQAYGAAPTKGDVTLTQKLAGWNGSPQYVTDAATTYDVYGRPTQVADAANHKTTTAYTPATGGPVTKTVVTNPAGHVTTTELDPAWGATTAVVDPNGKRTDVTYDPLGRTSQVWLPSHPRSANPSSPNSQYSYLIRTDGPVAVTTKTLRNDAGYNVSQTLYDGLLRERQTQAPAPGGGRVITDKVYDSRGLVVKENQEYYNDQAPATSLWIPGNDDDVPGQTVSTYDGAGRVTTAAFRVRGTEKWRTTTAYGGDHVDVTPPIGATPTTTYTDARDRTTELRQYRGGAVTGAYDATRYTYTPAGKVATVTDPAGNTWKYTYDLRGRKIKDDDPDKGTTTSTYDDLDRLVSTTDARGRTLAYTYDVLDRKTGLYDGSTSGTKLAEWTYDTLVNGTTVKGQLVASIRYAGTNAYRTEVNSYDEAYRATSTTVTIPAVEGKLAGTYQYGSTYNTDGTLASQGVPAAGGFPREVMTYGYDELGQPTTTRGLSTYVTATQYSKLGQPLWWTQQAGTGKRVQRYFYYDEGTNRLSRELTQKETAPAQVADVNYAYDPAGDVTSIADKPTGQTPDVQCFTYDYLQRLTEAWAQGSEGCASTPGPSVLGGPAPYWSSYSYDLTGNRTKEVRHAGSGDITRTSTYPAPGRPQPHTVTSVATSDGTTDAYTYDQTGNTISRKTATLEWDSEGHLAKVTDGGATTSFLYDADGDRLIRRDPTGTTLYLPGQEVRLDAATQALSCTRYYTHGDDVVATRGKTGLTWLASDHHDTNTVAISDSTQTVTLRRIDPFGNQRGAAPASWPGERGFVGGAMDPSTGLTHLGAREYDPTTGRFLSVDPVIDTDDPQQMNGYAYSDNNPVTLSDPDGLRPGRCDAKCWRIRTRLFNGAHKNLTGFHPVKAPFQSKRARAEYRHYSAAYKAMQPQISALIAKRQAAQAAAAKAAAAQAAAQRTARNQSWLSKAFNWVGDHWDTISTTMSIVGLGICIVASAGTCALVGVGIAGLNYARNAFKAGDAFDSHAVKTLAWDVATSVGLGYVGKGLTAGWKVTTAGRRVGVREGWSPTKGWFASPWTRVGMGANGAARQAGPAHGSRLALGITAENLLINAETAAPSTGTQYLGESWLNE
ncbi:RHS repeat-associated core domain-containing protein [Microbispora sp. H10830]|uniref:RHS repeat-associated core domain-containing protein n=1 Tax=Microbispora sp. H10830 TaxID=2729109 RepID=UPI0016015FC6|nr:RHS repeat-associated core domain-containing protein [Microbispora sp. H10830]